MSVEGGWPLRGRGKCPEALIPAVITIGGILERLPRFKLLAQSVFVTAAV